jgi:hypothetical protein
MPIPPLPCHLIIRASINVASGIKSQICTIEDRLVRKVVGRLHPTDVATLQTHLRNWLGLCNPLCITVQKSPMA